ncbi:Hypothetical protein IALB_0286 [Ignavibacterium album JCM 16511]|uniref:Outer membrane protein beta-barrel domain-containing protein n=1 Tax=Ignavibacterium album (strain DSM 19864 / JCM 16511 / NBRC 101810 / Mat9-16) TaxID=945713 RepID=I0AG91_IGNAJ|nr:hypothetical protein [Ignavibacterium album]AFH47998.1 Hypothetical protein IALB_0286 [Ignavibacterium album JCM 16511]
MKSIYTLILLSFISLSSLVLAQEDSAKANEDWQWHWDESENRDWKCSWDDDFDFGFSKSRPAISLNYGFGQINRNGMNKDFVKPNLVELKLGYIKDKSVWGKDDLINQSYRNLYISNESNKLSGKDPVGLEIESDMWRLGFERSKGFGFKLGESSALILYNGYTLNWSRIDFKYPNILTLLPDSEIETLNLYDESFRFGTSGVGGIRIKMNDNLMLDASYERSIVFQRHLFWKWAGSAIIESAAQGLLDKFINEIFESSPYAGPAVSFVLKNALSYGIYELRKERMNWPFKSEAPLSFDQFKFGLTFVF